MLRTCAIQLTNKVYKHCNLPEVRRAVYIYGFELFLSTALSIVSILIFSAVLSLFSDALLFLIVFCSLRPFVGGYHAKTYINCFFLTNLVYFATVITSQLIATVPSEALYVSIGIMLTLFSTITMLVLAPVRNANHPLSDMQYRRNQKTARILAIIWGVVSILLLILPIGRFWSAISTVTLMAVAGMMIIPKIQERRV